MARAHQHNRAIELLEADQRSTTTTDLYRPRADLRAGPPGRQDLGPTIHQCRHGARRLSDMTAARRYIRRLGRWSGADTLGSTALPPPSRRCVRSTESTGPNVRLQTTPGSSARSWPAVSTASSCSASPSRTTGGEEFCGLPSHPASQSGADKIGHAPGVGSEPTAAPSVAVISKSIFARWRTLPLNPAGNLCSV